MIVGYITFKNNYISYPCRWDGKKGEYSYLKYPVLKHIFEGNEAIEKLHFAYRNTIEHFLAIMRRFDSDWIIEKIYFDELDYTIFVEFTNHKQTMFCYYNISSRSGKRWGYFFNKDLEPNYRVISWSAITKLYYWISIYSHYGVKILENCPWNNVNGNLEYTKSSIPAQYEAALLIEKLQFTGADKQAISNALSLIY